MGLCVAGKALALRVGRASLACAEGIEAVLVLLAHVQGIRQIPFKHSVGSGQSEEAVQFAQNWYQG